MKEILLNHKGVRCPDPCLFYFCRGPRDTLVAFWGPLEHNLKTNRPDVLQGL